MKNHRKEQHMKGWWGVQPPPPGYWGHGWYEKTVTTNTTNLPSPPSVDEERVRRIVREEIADIMPVDVPDTIPEDFE